MTTAFISDISFNSCLASLGEPSRVQSTSRVAHEGEICQLLAAGPTTPLPHHHAGVPAPWVHAGADTRERERRVRDKRKIIAAEGGSEDRRSESIQSEMGGGGVVGGMRTR